MPAKFASVEQFLAARSPERRADVEALREVIHRADPELVETVKWNSPNYTLRGVDRLTINAVGEGPVRLILHFGTDRPEQKNVSPSFAGDPGELLTWHSDIRASLAWPPAAQRDEVLQLIRAWLAQP